MQVKKMMVRVALKYLGAATQYEVAEYLSAKFGKKIPPIGFYTDLYRLREDEDYH